jgi:predicted ATP-binding protein involved in virulence
MRIDKIEIRNFKKFAEQTIELDTKFTLLLGENGSGKTSALDALAVASGVWLVRELLPDSSLLGSSRPIYRPEIRLVPAQQGDRTLFQEAEGGSAVTAQGRIGDRDGIVWTRRLNPDSQATDNTGAKEAMTIIQKMFGEARANGQVLLPVIAYYTAGRRWLPYYPRKRPLRRLSVQARRWAAFYKCLKGRLRVKDLTEWFKDEVIAAVKRGGKFRPGFDVVRRAVRACVPDADDIWYDGDFDEIVLSVNREPQPFRNLSAGQAMMMALVADIAMKAVIQNNFLVPPQELTAEDDQTPRVLAQTPGVVLIDELEVHLHPRWQRRIASDLKRTFPNIQFVCTSHSPQVIGELKPDEIRVLDEPHAGKRPAHSFGLDSNAILEEVLDAESRSQSGREAIDAVEKALDAGDLDAARARLEELKRLQGGETRDTTRLEATINNLEALADAGD